MTDFSKHQEALRVSQRRTLNLGTTPEQCCEAVVKPSRIGWMIWPALLALALFSLWLLKVETANASEPPRPWIVWDLDADKPWTSAKGHQATATGPTACNLSLHEASKASPSGTRLACQRINSTKGE